jgi:phosphoserine aminotransferase
MAKKYNFNPGPAGLPQEVLKKAQDELLDFNGTGMSIMEISHRSKEFEAVINTAEAKVRTLLGVPANYSILFLQGGASLQFSMVPMNLLKGGTADYIYTGEWSKKAIKEAKLNGTVHIAASSEGNHFNSIPETFSFSPDAAYVHLTSNETIGGIQWTRFPDTGNVPLVADMSSDIFSRAIDIQRFGLIYAGAQKNLGPAGVTMVIIRNDLVEQGADGLPSMMSYKTHAKEKSLYNTPPCFAIYIVKLVLDWVEGKGGVKAIEAANNEKAKRLYDMIDSTSFYRGTAAAPYRSKMNVTFRMGSEELEEKFITEAKKAGFIGLKGHRSVGGCRASIYNAMSLEGVQELIRFMEKFAGENRG